MAAVTTVKNDSGICWINDTSDEDQQVVFVPGVSRERSLRTAFKAGSGSTSGERKPRMRAACGSESRSQSSSTTKSGKKRGQPLNLSSAEPTKGKGGVQSTLSLVVRSPTPDVHDLLNTPLATTETSQAKSKASLKDLCSEDKRRIANLIQELARVSEEKEESVQRLRDEQESFERKIQQLEQQNQLIVQERGSLQQQYRECQELLGLYQQYLSQQQEKLNQSIAQLSHTRPHSKAPSGEESSITRPTTRGAREPSRAAVEAAREAGSSYSGSASLSDHHRSAAPPSPPHSSSSSSSSSSGQRELTPAAQGRPVERRGGRSQDRRHRRRREPLTNGYGAEPGEPLPARGEKPSGCSDRRGDVPTGPLAPDVAPTLTTPLLGREDWEEKRHRLLVQKMQLEVERERLQARLAQQEDRLVRQSQQLHRSRRDYSRFQRAAAAELGQAAPRDGTGHAPGHDPLPDGRAAPSASRNGDGAGPSGGAVKLMREAPPPPHNASTLHPPPNGACNHGSPVSSRRDMATSPAVSQGNRKAGGPMPAMPFATPRTPQARLDSSLLDLLEAFSPISVPQRCRSTCTKQGRPSLLQTPQGRARPARRTPLSPHPHGQQDLEESQILEDIFFIC